jgi:hypothetical protein
VLINLSTYERMIAEALRPGILLYLSGLLSLLAGLAIINLHNTWRMDWRVIITVLGWLMTIGGIIRIVAPQITIACMMRPTTLPWQRCGPFQAIILFVWGKIILSAVIVVLVVVWLLATWLLQKWLWGLW